MSGTKTQLLLGMVTGFGASFALLQQITDRRLLAFPKPPPHEDMDGLYYQTLLYRRMWESTQAKGLGEFEAEKAARKGLNASLYATSRGINSAAEFLKRQMGDKPLEK